MLVFGAWDTGEGYPRPESLIAGLRSVVEEVVEVRERFSLAGNAKKRVAMGPHLWPGLAVRLLTEKRRLVRSFREAVGKHRPDAVFVPYPGHLITPWIRPYFAGPIILDLFLSVHDTVVVDRKRFREGSMVAGFLRRLDRRACDAADLVLMDTPEHADRVAELVGSAREKLDWVPVTDPAAPETFRPYAAPDESGVIEVLFFGTGVPLHGLVHLIDAVRRSPRVRLTLVGGTKEDRAEAQLLGVAKVRLLPTFVSRAELQELLDSCHLVAGIFSAGAKAQLVIPFKVVHALAAGRPVVTGDTPAVRSLLRPGVDCLLCSPGSSDELVDLFAALSPQDLSGIAGRARLSYEKCFSASAVARRLETCLDRVGVRSRAAVPSDPRTARLIPESAL